MLCARCFTSNTNPLNQVLGLFVDPARVMGSIHADGLKQLIFIISVEGWLTNQHFIQQHSERPPVDGEGVLLAQQDLTRKKTPPFTIAGYQPDAQVQPGCLKMRLLQNEYFPLSFEQYLWSNVVGGAAEGCSAILSKHVFLAHTKISNLYVSLMVQHHVV